RRSARRQAAGRYKRPMSSEEVSNCGLPCSAKLFVYRRVFVRVLLRRRFDACTVVAKFLKLAADHFLCKRLRQIKVYLKSLSLRRQFSLFQKFEVIGL